MIILLTKYKLFWVALGLSIRSKDTTATIAAAAATEETAETATGRQTCENNTTLEEEEREGVTELKVAGKLCAKGMLCCDQHVK